MHFPVEIYEKIIKKISITHPVKILFLSRDKELVGLFLSAFPSVEVIYLEEIGRDVLIADRDVRKALTYDLVVDDVFFESTGFDDDLIRAVGMHLNPEGYVISIAKSWDNVMAVNDALFINWFTDIRLLYSEEAKDRDAGIHAIKSSYYNTQLVWLQSYYTKAVRKQLSALLTRIEFGIDVEDNKRQFIKLCAENNISELYLKVFIASVTVDRDRILELFGLRVRE